MDFFHKNFAGVLAIKRFNRVFLMTNFPRYGQYTLFRRFVTMRQ